MSGNSAAFFEKWEKDQGKMKEMTPDILKGMGAMFQSVMKEGALSVKEKEFVALGVALAERCAPCINLHVQKCLGAGATKEQILEAAGVTVMMRGGPAFTHIPEIIDALEHLGA